MKAFNPKSLASLSLILIMLACSLPGVGIATEQVATSVPQIAATDTPASIVPTQPVETSTAVPSPTIEQPTPIPHSLIPSTVVEKARITVNDVVSVDTAAENRAPYGDSYNTSIFERPFMQDMTYVPDLDIVSYSLTYDEKFFYVSIELVGTNPNNDIGINYAVELDMNADGFGDYIIIGRPPHSVSWATDNVQIVEDTDRDTGGLSPAKSDAPLPGNGYDTVIFDGGRGETDDHDLAWMRVNAGKEATVQFAFKRTFAGERFMFGVLTDAGIKNVEDLDYADRFTEEEAGSPEKNEKDYPLKGLYGVDTLCREVYGFTGTGDEPRRCVFK